MNGGGGRPWPDETPMTPQSPPETETETDDSERELLEATIPLESAGRRFDQVLAELFPDFSRSRLTEWVKSGDALLDELVHLLGPVPEEADSVPSLFLEDDAEYSEVVTTMDRLEPAREVDPFASAHQTYAHILIDEAQDVTPMQWRMLRRRGSSASWTVVGDPAQSSWPDPAESARAVSDMVGNAPLRRFRMSTNYRSPAADVLAHMVTASRHAHWLNPEPKAYWDTGDSIVGEYAIHTDGAYECRNLRQLERFVASSVDV